MSKKLYLRLMFFGLLLVANYSTAQNKVSWGRYGAKNGYLMNIVPEKEGDFYVLQRVEKTINYSLEASYYNDLEKEGSSKVSSSISGTFSAVAGVLAVNDQLVLIHADSEKGNNKLFLHVFGKELKPVEEPTEIASNLAESKNYKLDQGARVIQSANKDYFAVYWKIDGGSVDMVKYGFAVFNNRLESVDSGEQVVSNSNEYNYLNGLYLSNTGVLYSIFTQFKFEVDPDFEEVEDSYNFTRIYRLSSEEESIIVDFEGKRLIEVSVIEDINGGAYLIGSYGDRNVKGTVGIFCAKFDIATETLIRYEFKEFEDGLVTSDWSDEEEEKLNRKLDFSVDLNRAVYQYEMRETYLLDDGSIVGSFEQNYKRSQYLFNNQIPYTFNGKISYVNRDVFLFKIGFEGTFDWVKKIEKRQASFNDFAEHSSYANFMSGEKVYFFFNDNSENYSELNGEVIIEDGFPQTVRPQLSVPSLAICEVDAKTGDISRKKYLDKPDYGLKLIPRYFMYDPSSSSVVVYGDKGERDCFGLMSLPE